MGVKECADRDEELKRHGVEDSSSKIYANISWDNEKYSNLDVIKKKINERIDLFNRGHVYTKVELDESFPDYILKNKDNLKEWII